jgi:hypothetical protein
MPLSPYAIDPLQEALLGKADAVLASTRQRQARRRGLLPPAARPSVAEPGADMAPDYDAQYRKMYAENPVLAAMYSPGPGNWRNTPEGRDRHAGIISDRSQAFRDVQQYHANYSGEDGGPGSERGAQKVYTHMNGPLPGGIAKQGRNYYDQTPEDLATRREKRAAEIKAMKDKNLLLAVQRGVANPATRALAQERGLVPRDADSANPLLAAIMNDPQVMNNPQLRGQLMGVALQHQQGMTPYQQGQLQLERDRLDLGREALSQKAGPGAAEPVTPPPTGSVSRVLDNLDVDNMTKEQIEEALRTAGAKPSDLHTFTRDGSPMGTMAWMWNQIMGDPARDDSRRAKSRKSLEKLGIPPLYYPR